MKSTMMGNESEEKWNGVKRIEVKRFHKNTQVTAMQGLTTIDYINHVDMMQEDVNPIYFRIVICAYLAEDQQTVSNSEWS